MRGVKGKRGGMEMNKFLSSLFRQAASLTKLC